MQCNTYSAIIWNACVKADQESKKNQDRFTTQSELQFMMKKSVPIILANSINFVIIRYITARQSAWQSIKAKHSNSNKVKLPYKEKKFYNTGWTYQNIKINKDEGYITLAKPLIQDDLGIDRRQKPLKCFTKSLPDNIAEIELVYRDGLKLAIKYKLENDNILIQSNNESAIDLGEIHAITAIDNQGNAIIITGRKLREIKQLRNKQFANIHRKQSKCVRGSNQYKKYAKALYRLKRETDKKILDSVHKITKLYVDYCVINNISKVYYGDLDNCTRNTKQDGRGNKTVRQKLSQWCYGLLMLELENKLTRYGIKLEKVKEYYTSKKCPVCKSLNKPTGRNYICGCGYKMHRDVNGAINILNDNSQYNISSYTNLKYLRIA